MKTVLDGTHADLSRHWRRCHVSHELLGKLPGLVVGGWVVGGLVVGWWVVGWFTCQHLCEGDNPRCLIAECSDASEKA